MLLQEPGVVRIPFGAFPTLVHDGRSVADDWGIDALAVLPAR
jgi:hypothetical protein